MVKPKSDNPDRLEAPADRPAARRAPQPAPQRSQPAHPPSSSSIHSRAEAYCRALGRTGNDLENCTDNVEEMCKTPYSGTGPDYCPAPPLPTTRRGR